MGGCCCCQKTKVKTEEEEVEEKLLFSLRSGELPIFWIFGGPGSGKGTQCSRLAKKYNLLHMSTGELLQEEVESGSALGRKLHGMMLTGELVPRHVVLDILLQGMIRGFNANNLTTGFLIDGYPREVIQGKEFEEKVGPCNRILYLKCSNEVMKDRLLERAFHHGREDDTEEIIERRLEVFHQISQPVIDAYNNITVVIDADNDLDYVFKHCSDEVEQVLNRTMQRNYFL